MDFLANFSGKNRLWVITAPSSADHYFRMMEKQIEETTGLNCRLVERDTFIVIIIQDAMMEGKIRRTTYQGEVIEEAIDSDTVSELLRYLSLQDGTFGMLVLKKNLKVGERFPYPVRIEAVLEAIDQLPLRKVEKLTRRGAFKRCRVPKRPVARRQGPITRKVRVSSPLRQANSTSVSFTQRRLGDKKDVLKNKVQDILRGKSRFVIRQSSKEASPQRTISAQPKMNRNHSSTTTREQEKSEYDFSSREDKNTTDPSRDKTAESAPARSGKGRKGDSKKKDKGKGKKGKKKGRKGRKKTRRATDSKADLSVLESFKNKRRLLIIAAPSEDNPLYIQQRDESVKYSCELAARKISVVTVLGSEHNGSVQLQHHLADADLSPDSPPEESSDLIAQLHKEYRIVYNTFFMTVTDYDLEPKQFFNVPVSIPLMMDYIDTFPSRQAEAEGETRHFVSCKERDNQSKAETFLSRFAAERRLLIVSSPTEEDDSFQQQKASLHGQACFLGLHHFALLILTGDGSRAAGSLQLFPLDGTGQSREEGLSPDIVNGFREHFKISREYFTVLVIGKGGTIKSRYPTPLLSTAIVDSLLYSTELQPDEEKLKETLGIRCPENPSSYYVH
ncbi:CCD80 protein, partial [Atractosteus spatula]|nr:CCD80 protein [Atractosteus spatula]